MPRTWSELDSEGTALHSSVSGFPFLYQLPSWPWRILALFLDALSFILLDHAWPFLSPRLSLTLDLLLLVIFLEMYTRQCLLSTYEEYKVDKHVYPYAVLMGTGSRAPSFGYGVEPCSCACNGINSYDGTDGVLHWLGCKIHELNELSGVRSTCSRYSVISIETRRSMRPIMCTWAVTQQPHGISDREPEGTVAWFLPMLVHCESNNPGKRQVTRTVRWTPAAEGWDGLVACCI